MKKYLVRIHGQNFKIRSLLRVRTFGFVTTRFVEAPTPQAAEAAAVELIRSDPHLVTRNRPDDPPMLYVDEIVELESFDGRPVPGAGYTFYRGE